MVGHEHDGQSGKELTGEQKLERLREGLVAIAQLQFEMDQLDEGIERDKTEAEKLLDSVNLRKGRLHELRRERQSQVDMSLVKEVSEQDPLLVDVEEIIQHASIVYAAGESHKGASASEVIHTFRRATKGQEVGIFSFGPRTFGTLTADAEIIVDDRSYAPDGPILFRLLLGKNEDDESPAVVTAAPGDVLFGREAMVQAYLEHVYDEGSDRYYYADSGRGDGNRTRINYLGDAARFMTTGLEDDRVLTYHEGLIETTGELIGTYVANGYYGEHDDLLSLLEAYRPVISEQDFNTLYNSLIARGVDVITDEGIIVRNDYITMMEKLTVSLQRPEEKYPSALDAARARVAVLEAIETKRQSLLEE